MEPNDVNKEMNKFSLSDMIFNNDCMVGSLQFRRSMRYLRVLFFSFLEHLRCLISERSCA
jgi:hypothetical protein